MLFFDGCTGCSSSGYIYTMGTLRSFAFVNGFDWDAFFIWVISWFTCWSFSWYTPLTGNLGGTAGGVAVLNISARGLNPSLCAFPNFTSGLGVAGLCGAFFKSCAARIVASAEEIFGVLNCCGKNYTVSDIRSALVFRMHAL